MAISIDLSGFKSAGVYTVEIDNSVRDDNSSPKPYRLIVGFADKGPFNRPVLLTTEKDRASVFGDIDLKLEHKGCFFNRALRTSLTSGPVLALNLLKTDDAISGKDQVNWAAMSLDAGQENPEIVGTSKKYGEYDYNTKALVPFVGQTPFATLYNRSRFWIPDKEMLTAVASNKFTSQDVATYEKSNLLNFANVGTEEFSVLVYKPTNVSGYDITCEQWYGSKDKIPYGWIRPYDLISDYFITVVCVKGNWTNYPVLATDSVWGEYFDKTGIKKNKVSNFLYADGVSVIGSWTGIIIPDFIDKQGNLMFIEKRVNNATEKTGLLMSFNKDALQVLNWDLNGFDNAGSEEEDKGIAQCGLDIDGSGEIESEQGETEAKYQVDMVGHNAFRTTKKETIEYGTTTIDASNNIDKADSSVFVKVSGVYKDAGYKTPTNLIFVNADSNGYDVSVASLSGSFVNASTGAYIDASVFKANAFKGGISIDDIKNTIADYYVLTDDNITTYNATFVSLNVTTVDASNANAEIIVRCAKHYVQINAGLALNGAKVIDASVKSIYNSSIKTEDVSTNNIKFLSYDYTSVEDDGVCVAIKAEYFNSSTFWIGDTPVDEDTKNMIIITNVDCTSDSMVKVGDYLNNIAYDNEAGVAAENNIIPGITKVTKKTFIQVNKGTQIATYKGKQYRVADTTKCYTVNNNFGFYLLTTTAAVQIKDNDAIRQLPISDDKISGILKFIPMKGLEITSRHRPGFDENGNLSIEGGIEKIYAVLEDEGIHRGLVNRNLHEYRYIVDTMSYGIGAEMGGKVYLSKLAKERGKCLAVLSLPSAKQFGVSSNPYFCDTYITGVSARPGLNTKYIPEGGNTEMGSTVLFSLPSMDNGADYTACFFPHLIYQENGREFSVPAAADCCNVLYRKFTGVADTYGICANNSGILSNNYMSGLEYECDQTDRDYLEPFGVNCVIKESGAIMIYGNQTAYQSVKSDKNKLHVRENLNTLEIECDAICRRFNFLYNTASVRAELVSQITAVLQVMQVSGAIDSYTVTCDETNNTKEVIAEDCCIVDVEVVMNHGMEKIIQRFTLNRRTEE